MSTIQSAIDRFVSFYIALDRQTSSALTSLYHPDAVLIDPFGEHSGLNAIQRCIFPGGFLPSLTAMHTLMTRHTDFAVRNVFDMGPDYEPSLDIFRFFQGKTEAWGRVQDRRNLASPSAPSPFLHPTCAIRRTDHENATCYRYQRLFNGLNRAF